MAASTNDCEEFSGATAGEKIAACIAALPQFGGIADASSFRGPQIIDTEISTGDKASVSLMLGHAVFQVKAGFKIGGGFTVVGAGRGITIIEQMEPAVTVFNVGAGATSFEIRDLSVRSASEQSGGAAVVLDGKGTSANANSLIQNVEFVGQWIGVDAKVAAGWRTDKCSFNNVRFRGIRINDTANGDEGDNWITDNVFSSDPGIDAIAIEHIAGGGLNVTGNKFFTFDIAYLMNWTTSANSGQLIISNNRFESQKSSHIQFQRGGAGGTFNGVSIHGNWLRSDEVYPGTHIRFVSAADLWVSGVLISGNFMEVSTKTVAIKFEGRAGDGALIDGNLIRGTGASGGISISSDYHEIMIGVNSILVGRAALTARVLDLEALI